MPNVYFTLFFLIAYVGLATVMGFIWWFLYSDSGPKLPYSELVSVTFNLVCVGTLWFFELHSIRVLY